MNIQLIEIIIIVFLGLIMMPLKNNAKTRRTYIIIIIAFLWFIASMRSNKTGVFMGKDTMNYCNEFYDIFYLSWKDLKKVFILRYYYGIGEYDIGYTFLVKFISLFTHQWNIFSLAVQSLFFVPFAILLNRFSKKIIHLIFAFIFYIALVQNYLFFGVRQMYAIGLCLISFIYILDNRYKKALIIVLLASSIHLSSFIFLGPIILSKYSFSIIKKTYILSFLSIALVFSMGTIIISNMGTLLGMERYTLYSDSKGASGFTFFILLELLSLFCFITFKRNIIERSVQLKTMYSILPFITFFTGFITVNPNLQRLSLYFYVFMALAFPLAIDMFFIKFKDKTIFHLIAILMLSIMIFKIHKLEYLFFWQESQILW